MFDPLIMCTPTCNYTSSTRTTFGMFNHVPSNSPPVSILTLQGTPNCSTPWIKASSTGSALFGDTFKNIVSRLKPSIPSPNQFVVSINMPQHIWWRHRILLPMHYISIMRSYDRRINPPKWITNTLPLNTDATTPWMTCHFFQHNVEKERLSPGPLHLGQHEK